jgi:hypothetical protein
MAQITIASTSIPGWQGSSSGITLHIYTNAAFAAASGTLYPQTILSNAASLGTFFLSFACTVSGGALVIPAITIDSTTDALDNPAATYTAVVWDTNAGMAVQPIGTFYLLPSPTSTTWAAIFAAEAVS